MELVNMSMRAVQARELWISAAALATAVCSPPVVQQSELAEIRFGDADARLVERDLQPIEKESQAEEHLLQENRVLRANVDAKRVELEAYDTSLQQRLGTLSAEQRALLIEGRLLTNDYRTFQQNLSEKEKELAAQVKEVEERVKDLSGKVDTLLTDSTKLRDNVTTTLEASRVLGEDLEKAEKRAATLEEAVSAYIKAINSMRAEAAYWRARHHPHIGKDL